MTNPDTHECSPPYDGKWRDQWTCPDCGTIFELDHFEEDGPFWESIGQVESEEL
jgi:hypothetical protein